MKLLAVVNEQVHQDAMAAARRVGTDQVASVKGLHTVQMDEVMRWVNRLWDPIEEAIAKACREGIVMARPMIDALNEQLTELYTNVSKQAKEVRSIIAERLNVYLLEVIDGALGRVRASINVGGQQLAIKNVTVEQSLKISNSLKMSLSEICEFVAEGEITLAAEYAQARGATE